MWERVPIGLFAAWLVGYFAHWATRYDNLRPLLGVLSILLVLLLSAAVRGEKSKDPPR